MSTNDRDDKVGYKSPPRRTQFKKGQSGNPAGRRKVSASLALALQEELATKIRLSEGGRRRNLTKREAILRRLSQMASAGNMEAADILVKNSSKDEKERDFIILPPPKR